MSARLLRPGLTSEANQPPVARLVRSWLVILVGLGLLLGGVRGASAEEPSRAHPTTGTFAPIEAATPAKSPALDLEANPSLEEKPSVFHRWWFWTAVGGAAAATLAVIVLSARGSDPPATDLGNQAFRP